MWFGVQQECLRHARASVKLDRADDDERCAPHEHVAVLRQVGVQPVSCVCCRRDLVVLHGMVVARCLCSGNLLIYLGAAAKECWDRTSLGPGLALQALTNTFDSTNSNHRLHVFQVGCMNLTSNKGTQPVIDLSEYSIVQANIYVAP